MSVRVAVIDSGVHASHPHLGGVAGGVAILENGLGPDFVDRIGHGTAVAAVIREKAPDALIYAVKVFDRALTARVEVILRALEWCFDRNMQVINLSLGTLNPAHRAAFESALKRATVACALVVAARDVDGQPSLPGCLPGAISVALDWNCPRDTYRREVIDGREVFFACGYPRPIPGIPPEHNLRGMSFAVANVAGFIAQALAVGSATYSTALP